MPTYEYVCKSCGHLFEIVQSMKDDPLTECLECGGELRKVFAPPAISFKGSGFYATDHRKKAASSSDRTGDGTGDRGEKSPDKKPDKKKESGAGSGSSDKVSTPGASGGKGGSSSGSGSGPGSSDP